MKGQITEALPKSAWESVEVQEYGEPVVEVPASRQICVGLVRRPYRLSVRVEKQVGEKVFEVAEYLRAGNLAVYVRATIAEKLLRVSQRLPEGVNLALIEGVRSLEQQGEYWKYMLSGVRFHYSDWSDEAVEKMAGRLVAPPRPLANHNCGGAIDVTLCDDHGNLLDMGTEYPATNDHLFKAAGDAALRARMEMLSATVTKMQAHNRKTLREAMETEDFVWYPLVWWHYCWGDRMWAAYSGQPTCVYGPLSVDTPSA